MKNIEKQILNKILELCDKDIRLSISGHYGEYTISWGDSGDHIHVLGLNDPVKEEMLTALHKIESKMFKKGLL